MVGKKLEPTRNGGVHMERNMMLWWGPFRCCQAWHAGSADWGPLKARWGKGEITKSHGPRRLAS